MVRGKTVRHCHGKNKGKLIKRHRSHAAAVAQHGAIMAKKKRKR